MNETTEVKNCAYRDCSNTILTTSQFTYCEVCRALVLRNQIALLTDPTSPTMERQDMVFDNMVHLMRPEEILNTVRKVETLYLELQKQLRSRDLEIYRAKKFADAVNEVQEARSTRESKPNPNRRKKSKKEKLTEKFGEKMAKEILGMTDDELDF